MIIESIHQGRIHVKQGLSDGVTCPCCTQLCKLYHRSIYRAPARAMCRLYGLSQGVAGQYFHMKDIGTPKSGGGDFSKLAYWGFIIPSPKEAHDDPKRKTSGLWALTEKGINWINGLTTVKKSCYVFNNKVTEFDGPQISVFDALGSDSEFNYAEVTGKLI